MPRNTKIGMFNVPNYLGGVPKGLMSAGLGGSSGSLVADPFGGGGPQAREVGALGTGLDPMPVNDISACMQSMAITGQPTPCPPNQSHQPAPCGPCQAIGTPGETPSQQAFQTPGETAIACPDPTSPNPGKPGQYRWNSMSCKWESATAMATSPVRTGGSLSEQALIAKDIIGGGQRVGRQRGAVSRTELGQFGRMGGGVGGGAMGDLELFENPLLAGGSEYLGKNVAQFAGGGRMKNPYTYPDGGRVAFANAFSDNFKRALNSTVAAGQIARVNENNRSARRFTSGGKF
jgi:hypothetical protein